MTKSTRGTVATWPKALAAGLALLSVLATASPAAAYQSARFWVTVEGTQTSRWKLPYFIDSSNCYMKHWTKASGRETLNFQSVRTRLLVTHFAGQTTWSFGSWSPIGGHDLLRATGTWIAHADFEGGDVPGSCGGSTSFDPAPLYVCGSRSVTLGLVFQQVARQRRALSISEQTESGGPPLSCPQTGPQFANGASQEFTSISALVPDRELFDHSIGKEIVLAGKHFPGVNRPGTRPGTGSTTTRWTLTLTRVR